MTIEEKDIVIQNHCNNSVCDTCIIKDLCDDCDGDFIDNAAYAEEAFKIIQSLNCNKDSSNVDHPSHYNQGGIECIDGMVSAFGKEKVADFCIINAFKYLWRSEHKNGLEDIDKAIWYLNKYKELREETDDENN